MKNKKNIITAPLFVSVILFLMPLSEKLLRLTVNNDSNLLLSASAVQLFIFALPAAFYCKIRGIDFLKHAKVKRPPVSSIPFVAASAFTYFLSAIILLYIEYNLLSFSGEDTLAAAAGAAEPFGIALAYVIVPAVSEELFFRSILLSDYSEFKGPLAIAISALFFAMLHFSFVQFPMYFILGIILATMTYVTQSSFPAITVHLINNTLVVFFGKETGEFLKESSSSVILVFVLVIAFMASFAMMLSSMENIYEKRSMLYESGELPGSRREALNGLAKAGKLDVEEKQLVKNAGIFLSPTFFLSVLMFILITLDII